MLLSDQVSATENDDERAKPHQLFDAYRALGRRGGIRVVESPETKDVSTAYCDREGRATTGINSRT